MGFARWVNFKFALALVSFRYLLNVETIREAMASTACTGTHVFFRTLVQAQKKVTRLLQARTPNAPLENLRGFLWLF